jgi:hypothetical protein
MVLRCEREDVRVAPSRDVPDREAKGVLESEQGTLSVPLDMG